MIEDIEFDTEWPGLTVLALSLLTKESGLGIICTWSEKSTRFRLNVLLVGLSSGLAAASGVWSSDWMVESMDPGNGS